MIRCSVTDRSIFTGLTADPATDDEREVALRIAFFCSSSSVLHARPMVFTATEADAKSQTALLGFGP
jgi:hypothetical protein